MMRSTRSWNLCLLLTTVLVGATVPVLAAPPAADVLLGGAHVEWRPNLEHAGLTLTVSGPAGISRHTFEPGESPRFELAALAGEIDGVYTWEISARPLLDDSTMRAMAAARTAGDRGSRQRPAGLPSRESLIQSGSFRVVHGAIVQPAVEEPAPSQRVVAAANRATAEQLITGDLSVHNSLCVGIDCAAAESYGFDTIRLKENNLRIHFSDTSVGSFPTNDWRLVANDSANGGRNVFYLEDSVTGREVFSVEAGARSNSVWVDNGGHVGFGTSTPSLDLHAKTGDTPGLRLEQDGSSGFTPQIWDLAGNEANFFVRDVSHASALSFRVLAGAGDDLLVLKDGKVGINTDNPSAMLHMTTSAADSQLLIQNTNASETERTLLRLENNGVADFAMQDSSADGSTWSFQAEGPSFRINKAGSGGDEIVVRDRNDGLGQATLVVNGSVQATNVTFSSSRSLKSGFQPVDTTDVLERLAALPMTEWTFNEEANGRRHIGPIAEDFNAAFELGADSASISVIDANGITMAAVQGLYRQLRERDQEVSELRSQVEQLSQTVEELAGEGR